MAKACLIARPLSELQKSILEDSKTKKRFWSKVIKTQGCWNWKGGSQRGYGYFIVDGQCKRSHRISYYYAYKIDQPELSTDHLCRNTRCVNPSHLEMVTIQENTRRGFGIASLNRRKTHCKRGHELSGKNLHVSGNVNDKRRRCKICMRFSKKVFIPHPDNCRNCNASFMKDICNKRHCSKKCQLEAEKIVKLESKRRLRIMRRHG